MLGLSLQTFTVLHVIISLVETGTGFVVVAVVALYLNTFVLVVQRFLKIPRLMALAPTGTEPPFAVVQLLVLIGFVVLGCLAVRTFHPGPRVATAAAV